MFDGIQKLLDVFELQPSIKDSAGARRIQHTNGHIVFDSVEFSYSSRPRPILKDLSFEVHPGTTVAIVGHSGSGKSTIFKILDRVFPFQSGRILIDGIDLEHIQLNSLRRAITFAPAGIQTFDDLSISENLKCGGEFSSEEIEKACRNAEVHDIISKLPEGYESHVRPEELSDGEKQRIGIARAFLHREKTLLMDEPTSFLDAETQNSILKKFAELGGTTLITANRISTAKAADIIFVLKYGRVVERGAHNELMEQNGVYHKLYNYEVNEMN
ncbi:hypothetical protein N7478_000673 [Penicillium angulare]|uniref:uncharacterized protein n=1 Tax=Penicillium angulare TaxID=116970 RepID=UPI0025425871|nr:uncharacterized protein N7478_000673 [Penicillium angulare]KAJ5291422.1 hypothetical protein N7478_000673 [Penicillium angulare]